MNGRRQFLRGMAAMATLPLIAGQARAQMNPWSTGPVLPYTVQEIYPAFWRRQIIVAGGLRASGPGFMANMDGLWPTVSVVSYRPGARRWTRLPDLPAARHHPLLLAEERRLWCIGGFGADGDGMWRNQADVWWLEPGMRDWRDGPALPTAQSECAGGILPDGSLLITAGRTPTVGGRNRDYADNYDTNTSWRLFPGDSQWEAAAPLPLARNSSAFAMAEGMLHVMGGRLFDPAARLQGEPGLKSVIDHSIYDPQTDQWQSRPPMPMPRAGHAAAYAAGRIFTFGGEDFSPEPVVHGEIFSFDPATDQWQISGNMPTPRHGLGAVAAGQRIHSIAGAAQAGGRETTAQHEIFQP